MNLFPKRHVLLEISWHELKSLRLEGWAWGLYQLFQINWHLSRTLRRHFDHHE